MKLRDLFEYDRTTEGGAGEGRVPIADAPDPHGGTDPDLAPGTGDDDLGDVDPASAGTENADRDQQPPQAVPYSRFKEVNEKRRQLETSHQPYAELEQMGYEAGDLRRLAEWELEYVQDPVGTWVRQLETLDQVPQEVKEAVAAQLQKAQPQRPQGNSTEQPTPPGSGEEPPEWAKPLFEQMNETKADKEARVAAERADAERQAGDQLLGGILDTWREMDKKDKIVTPEESMLAHVISASHRGDDPEQILALARSEWLKSRETILSESDPRPPGSAPRPVPGGGSGDTPPNAPPAPKTLGQASKLAMAAMADGSLPVEE